MVMAVIIVSFLDAATTVDVLRASSTNVKLVETQTVLKSLSHFEII